LQEEATQAAWARSTVNAARCPDQGAVMGFTWFKQGSVAGSSGAVGAVAASSPLFGSVPRYSSNLVEFGIGRTGLGSNNSRGNNHSNEGKGDQNIMHGCSLLCESSNELLHTLIIDLIGKFLNPTKTA